MMAKVKNFEEIQVGDTAFFERVINGDDINKFAELSGDYNPLHTDEAYAAQSEFGGRVVYGLLLGAWVSRLVGMELPGAKALLVKESLDFKRPARIGDSLIVKGEVIHKSQSTRLVELAITISKGEQVLASGSVQVRVLN